jgi:hypothetical protein
MHLMLLHQESGVKGSPGECARDGRAQRSTQCSPPGTISAIRCVPTFDLF